VSGAAVEIDSAIIEQIADPLLHLVQNAIAHGLETEDERRGAGKPAEGTIHLRAHHENGAVLVEVEDDGRGIDVEGLRTHAAGRGLITAEAAPLLSDHEVLSLIFLPGFTTARQVTAASGRGIGLDVVRTNVARINGDVEVTTRPGAGTRFRIRIPLTVLISDALLVGVGGETFAVPLNTVTQVMTVAPERIQSAGEKEMVWVRDQLVDLIRLDRYLALPVAAPRREVTLLVLRSGGRSLAVAVDDLHGKDELVIKRLGGFPAGVGPFSSGTISAEGRVILVLNPARLLPPSGGLSPFAESRVRVEPERPPAEVRRPRTDAARRFLLVDDSISVRKFVGQMLERSGFEVVTASNGAEALQRLEHTAIHAVITDLEMPNGNGYELIENLRRRPSTRDLPIVILTTRSGDKHQELARRLGVEHYLTKPVDEAAFVALMASLVPEPTAATTRPDGPA